MLQKMYLIIFGVVPLCIGVEGFATGDTSILIRSMFGFGVTIILLALLDEIKEKKKGI